jgi:hypothetical protein
MNSRADETLIKQVAAYLEKNDWSVIVIGPAVVKQYPEDGPFIYEFAVRFTGKKRDRAHESSGKENPAPQGRNAKSSSKLSNQKQAKRKERP